jgi:hypothetical protein
VEWSLLRETAAGLCTFAYLLAGGRTDSDRREKGEAAAVTGQIDYGGTTI